VLNLRGSKLYVQCYVCVAVYLDGKHKIRSCLDLIAIAIDGSTGSDVGDLPHNQKMNHDSR
jgi:hypothetical protein